MYLIVLSKSTHKGRSSAICQSICLFRIGPSSRGNTKSEIDYIMTDKPSMVTDVTVINRVNIGSDHRMVMASITLNTRAERRKFLNKNTRTRVDTQMIGTKKNTFQLELKNRFTALEEHDDMDSLNKNMTEMIQQSALSIAKQTKKQKNPKISSPTRALMKVKVNSSPDSMS